MRTYKICQWSFEQKHWVQSNWMILTIRNWMWMSCLILKMLSFLLWIIWKIMFICMWNLWCSDYAIWLSICFWVEAVELNCEFKFTSTKYIQQIRQWNQKLLWKKQAVMYDHKKISKVSMKIDCEKTNRLQDSFKEKEEFYW